MHTFELEVFHQSIALIYLYWLCMGSIGYRGYRQHISLIKISWILGDKQGKASANAFAKRLTMPRVNWAAAVAADGEQQTVTSVAVEAGGEGPAERVVEVARRQASYPAAP